ncbi:MAG: hypothetical protein UT09_C0040G0011 [Parcubacteria group bacterium GW2011_GWF2_38_8]|nr:MAG: hypothetical protein UT09_C0040G0011 [Parcubacteria group bacterium GW2011_GWF2_38_8]
MKTIQEWQKIISEATNRKFPNNVNKSQMDRVKSIKEQLEDVENSLKVEQGLLKNDDHAHQDPDHRIAALIANIFILAEMRGSKIEKELEKVLSWFQQTKV